MINLLPEEQKAKWWRRYRARRSTTVALALALWLALAGGIAGAVNWFAREETVRLAARLAERGDQGSLNQVVAEEQALARFARQVAAWSNLTETADTRLFVLLRELGANRPAGVTISDWRYEEGEGGRALELAGRTASREALIAFTDQLEADSRFAAIEAPLANLVRATDSPFTLKLILASS